MEGAIMYLRFCTQTPCRDTRGASWGLFRPAYFYRDHPSTPVWLADAIAEEISWFCRELPVPSRFAVYSKKHWRSSGVCWFHDRAREHVSRAWGLAALVEIAGTPLITVTARDPGEVLYRDDFQVVAKNRKGYVPAAVGRC
jgi:hypothetical protein